jgi:hypothetical protein
MPLRVASNAQPRRDNLDLGSNAVEEFRIANGSGLTTPTRITKAAMLVLAAAWPLALPFDELYARSRALLPASNAPPGDERVALASEILPGYGAGVVELHSTPSPFVTDVSERPVGSPVARFQLQRGLQAASLRHEHGTFSEETCRLFLLLDGTRTRREIAATFWPGVPEATSMSDLDAALAHLARMALLVR